MSETNNDKDTIRKQIESEKFQLAVANVLPAHVTPARFVRISIAALTRVPKLSECDPNTVLQCLMQLSQFGLEPDGRNAHLIPFWNSKRGVNECQLIVDYKGLVDLAMRSGKVAFIHADKVCEHDVFEWNKGQVVKHEINFQSDRGKPYAYYALARMKDGTEKAEVMPLEDVQGIRKRSRAANAGPWVTDFDEMAKKTVFRRLSKWLQLSPEYREALDADADALEELRFENALPITRAKVKLLKGGKNKSSDGDGVSHPAQTPDAAAAPKEKKTEKLTPKTKVRSTKEESTLVEVQNELRNEILNRLAAINCTEQHLMTVAKANEWVSEDQTWPVPDAKLTEWLDADNWKTIVGELNELKK